jgi:PAS domain S-box-containing protein
VADLPRVDDSPDEGEKPEDSIASRWYSDMPRVFKGDRTATRASLYFFVVMLLFVGAVGLPPSEWTSGPVLYGTLEALCTLLAFVVGALALVRFYSKKQETFLFIGTGFFGAAFLDLFPAILATRRMGDWASGELEGLATWSFTASGTFLSLFLFASWWAWHRRLSDPEKKPIRETTVYLTALLLAILIFAIFDLFPLRGSLRPDQVIRQPAEIVPGLIFLLGAVGYLTKKHWQVDAFEHWLIVALLVGVMIHGAYMPFSAQYHDALFVSAHVMKVLSYASVLVGLLASVYVTFRREEEVAESTREANTALAREIDYRRQAERVIQESEGRLQDFLDNAHDLIQSVDPDGKFIYVNRAWKKVLGYTDEEVRALTFFQILDPGCRKRCRRDFAKVLGGEALPVLEVDFVASDGRVVKCSGSANVWLKDGEPVATRSIFRDITEQLRASRKLEAFQANLRALVENTGDAIWSVDRAKRLITFNTAFSMSLEVRTDREPKVGDRPSDCLPAGDVAWYQDMYERALYGEAFSELRDEEIGGQIRSFEFFFNPIREAAGIIGVAAFEKDVTARRRIQLALRMAKEEAEQANQAKSQFLASMSHELRTPLNSVIGFTNILLKNRGGHLAEQEVSFLERIIANGKHLLDLINEVLDLAKIEAGRMDLDLGTFGLESLVGETLSQMEGQVKDKNVLLRSDVPPGIGPVEGDAGKLKQVIINLVGNALKFTRKGEVVVEVLVQEDGRTPGAIAVRDTGIGIPLDRLQAIFEAFQQADGTTNREFGGTGLGLTISRSLCQLMGYDLRVESQVGEGSTFTILLTDGASPEKRAEKELMEEALKPMESSRPGSGSSETGTRRARPSRILVIDDDADTRRLLTNQLEELRFEVITASSAEVGLQAARKERPDLITLDLIMPEMTGWEALKEFKEARDLQDIPVVIISVVAGEQDRGNIFGAVDLLTKPVDRDDLIRVLRRNLREPRGGRVLVVEDEAGTQELFRRYLEDIGLQVTLAGNGEEAEVALGKFTPEIILLDLVMPVMDGTAFLQRLRRDPTRVEIPVIICTGKELSVDERKRLLSQATEIVAKGDDLETKLRRVLSSFFPLDVELSPRSGKAGSGSEGPLES